MNIKPYGMICPITHACQILEPRWTIPILTEMWGGASRFNDIRRGVGNISTALLSKRLKELEANGLIERVEDPTTGQVEYRRTQCAIDLEPALDALAKWAQCNIQARQALEDLDLSTLMWHMRDYILLEELPRRQVIIQFHFGDPGLSYDTYWTVCRPDLPIEICTSIPGFDVDVFVETDKISLSALLLSRTTVSREIEAGRLYLSGDPELAGSMDKWLHHRVKESRNEILQLDEAQKSKSRPRGAT
ncbi:MAG: helix-turn-helix domain-containing protein [Pseudomonadota bacterium]